MLDLRKPLQVIAHFSLNGGIKPLKLCMQGEEGENVVVDKIKTVTVDQDKAGNRLFHCIIQLYGVERHCNIAYSKDNGKWVLHKI
jgi:hypothetical protein